MAKCVDYVCAFYYNTLMNDKKEIIAVLDPMCSWCWGFEPTLQELRKNLPQDTKLSLCMGGLRSSGDEAWTAEFKAYLAEHWGHVFSQTGQPFNKVLFEKESFDYDTEPACRALVTVRYLDEKRAFTFMNALQKAFYQDGRDITQTDVLCDIALETGLDRDVFKELFLSQKMRESTQADKYKARSMGANSFPSLVFIDAEGHLYVLKGYRTFEEVKKHL